MSSDRSEWRQGASRRRDFRQSHDEPEAPRHRAHKDRSRWCGGHVGREHGEAVADPTSLYGKVIFVRHRCPRCGKVLRWEFPDAWRSGGPPS